MNFVLVETWEAFKIPSETITHYDFKRTHLTPLSPLDKEINHKSCLAYTQISKGQKADYTELIYKATIAPAYLEETSTVESMVILRHKGRVCSSHNLQIREASYDTIRTRNILPLQ